MGIQIRTRRWVEGTMASDRTFSRRRFLGVLGGGAAMTIVAACGGGQQAAPAAKTESKPAESKPAES